MGRSSADIQREIVETRRNIDGQVIELRRQSRVQAGRILSVALIGLGAAVAVGTAFAVYRLTRPMSYQERLGRVLPRRQTRKALRRAGRAQKGRVVVEQREHGWEKMAMKIARAAGTAAASAAVSRIVQSRQRAQSAEAPRKA